jgi:hypothetical protein
MPKNDKLLTIYHFLLIIVFFSSGLYLLGFSLNGVNVYGFIDPLIPYERALCWFLAVVMWALTLHHLSRIFRLID